MKYYALFVLLALIGACYTKPLAEQLVTADPSSPTIVSDYSSAVKGEPQASQENPTQTSDAVKSTIPAAASEKVAEAAPSSSSASPSEPAKDEAKNAKLEVTPNLAAVATEQAQESTPTVSAEQIDAGKKLAESSTIEEKKPVQQQQESNNVVSSGQDVVKDNVVAPNAENSAAIQQDTVRSEEIAKTSAVTEVAPSHQSSSNVIKDSEKKLDHEDIAVSTETPKQSNNQINSVSVDEPQSSELKSDLDKKSSAEVINQEGNVVKPQNEPTSSPVDAGKKEESAPIVDSKISESSKESSEVKPESTLAKSEQNNAVQTSSEEQSSGEAKDDSKEQKASLLTNQPSATKLDSSEESKITTAKSEEKPNENKPSEEPAKSSSEEKEKPKKDETAKKTEIQSQSSDAEEAKPVKEPASKPEGSEKKGKAYIQKREAGKFDDKKPTETYVKKDDLKNKKKTEEKHGQSENNNIENKNKS